tara:strand:- start:49 stop:279 length:231 start_codon:yes stop_codon:yes gene_type:complete
MSKNKYDYEKELKAAKRAEIERLYFEMELTNEELLAEYKALDIKKEKFEDNLELLDFPEENSIGWRIAEDMTEEDL